MYLQIVYLRNELWHFVKLLEDMQVGFYFFNYATPPNKEWPSPSPSHNSTQCLKSGKFKKIYTVPRTISNHVF